MMKNQVDLSRSAAEYAIGRSIQQCERHSG